MRSEMLERLMAYQKLSKQQNVEITQKQERLDRMSRRLLAYKEYRK